jgi:hydroxyacylglutathione hydrolase
MIKAFQVGIIGTNCYFYQKNGENFIFDPGGDYEETKTLVKSLNVSINYVMLTHAHIDHILGVKAVKDLFPNCKVCIHKSDIELYEKVKEQGLSFGLQCNTGGDLPEPDVIFENETVFSGFKVIETPGHSPGGVCFLDEDKNILISGDTIFRFGIGRYDLWGSSLRELKHSIKNIILKLPEEIEIYPGHGPKTTVKEEKSGNPIFDVGGFL